VYRETSIVEIRHYVRTGYRVYVLPPKRLYIFHDKIIIVIIIVIVIEFFVGDSYTDSFEVEAIAGIWTCVSERLEVRGLGHINCLLSLGEGDLNLLEYAFLCNTSLKKFATACIFFFRLMCRSRNFLPYLTLLSYGFSRLFSCLIFEGLYISPLKE